MEKQQTTNELGKCLIHLEQNGEDLKIVLEGSIRNWFILLERVSDTTPEFKKAIELTAGFFEFEKNKEQNK